METQNMPVDRKMMREMNQNSLLNLIRLHAPVSRVTLAALSGLSPATIIGITNELIEEGVIKEGGSAESTTRGPKPVLLEINADGRYAIGIKVTEHDVFSVAVNLQGDVVFTEHTHMETLIHGPHILSILREQVRALIAHSGLVMSKIIGVGCALPGLVDVERGYCVLSWHLGLRDIAISEPLGEALDLPVFVNNDVGCLAVYEKLFGSGQNYRNFVTMTIGSGIGMGLIVNGDLYLGAGGGSAEIGHIPVVENGRLCACGKRGCLEAYAGDQGIIENYREAQSDATHEQALTMMTLLQRADAGEREARVAFERAGFYLGLGLATVVNLFNPECIILSGPSIEARALWFPSMEQTLTSHALAPLLGNTQILCETLRYSDWARGAASMALRHFFLPPTLTMKGSKTL